MATSWREPLSPTFQEGGALAGLNEDAAMTCFFLALLGLVDALWLAFASSLRSETASVGLIVGAVGGGMVGTAAMVFFFPLAARLGGASSIAAMSAGAGACGLAAFLISAASRTGEAFGTGSYFLLVSTLQATGLVAFGCLWACGCAQVGGRRGELLARK